MSNKNLHIGLFILRFSLAALMLFHGLYKLANGLGGIEQMLRNAGWPTFLAYGVYLGEIVAPIMMILGYRTRLAAIVFASVMLVAFILAHPDKLFALGKGGVWAIETIALFFFGGIALAFTGGGKYALSTRHRLD